MVTAAKNAGGGVSWETMARGAEAARAWGESWHVDANHVHKMGVFHAKPRRKHASVGASDGNDRKNTLVRFTKASETIVGFQTFNDDCIVSESLFNTKKTKLLPRGSVAKWSAASIKSMLSEDNKSTKIGSIIEWEPSVVVKFFKWTFVPCVKETRTPDA